MQQQNKLDRYRCINCMKKFCKDLGEHAMRIVNYEKKMILLTGEENKFYEEKKSL